MNARLGTMVTYEIWSERSNGTRRRRVDYDIPADKLEVVSNYVKRWNDKEQVSAKVEDRPVKVRYFLVEATTTRKEQT